MRAVLVRELTVITRQPAIPVALVLTGVTLAAFILAWPHGMPVVPGVDSYDQTRALAGLLFAFTLPWVSMRAASPERGNALVLWSAFLGTPAASIIGAKVVAHSMVLALIVLTAYPALVMAEQAAAVPWSTTALDAMALEGVAVLASSLAIGCSLLVTGRLAAWMLATALTIAILVMTWTVAPELRFVGAISGLTGVAVTCAMAAWAQSSVFYLRNGDD